MALQVPFKIFLNTASTAVIVTDNADVVLQTVARNTISVQPVSTDRIRLFLNDSNSYLYTDILDGAGATYGANRDLAARALSNLAGFNLGGGGGAVTSVNGDTGIVTVDLASVLAEGTLEPDGNYGFNFVGGVATLIPIQGETVGSYKAFAHTNIPSNYLWCNGAIVLIANYPDLFAEIGNTYGGNGITTFGIPNLQGRFLQGDNGSNIGVESGVNTLSIGQLPIVNASGTIQVSTNNGNISAANGSYFANVTVAGEEGLGFVTNGNQNPVVNVAGVNVNFGSNQPHEHPHLVARIAICFESVGVSGASPTPSFNAVLAVNKNSLIRAELNGVGYATLTDLLISNFITVKSLADLTTPVLGVINIPTKTTLFFPNEINLAGNRLSFAQDCAIIGTSSETSKVTSSLGNGIALITSVGSLAIQNIALQVVPLIGGDVPIMFNLNGISEPMAAIDWNFVNIIDCNIGSIQNYANAVFLNCAFIGSTNGVTFDGNFDSIVFEGCIFRNGISGTCITIAATAIINRRIRLENTSIVATGANIGINVSVLATIPIEGYIAKFINFSGGGTYLAGIQPNDNKSLFIECRGVSNSASVSEVYMINNATATVIASTAVFYKILGTTLSGVYVQRFTNTNNRATYTGALTKFFRVSAIVSANAGNNQLLVLRIAKNGVTIVSSENQGTTSGAGRSESLKSQTVVELNTNDYIEVFIQNNTAIANITASELNLILTPLN